jgi:hypothetical protein
MKNANWTIRKLLWFVATFAVGAAVLTTTDGNLTAAILTSGAMALTLIVTRLV